MKTQIILIVTAISISIGAAQAKKHRVTEVGTTFENVSNLLAPFTRTGIDGHGGFAWLDYDADNDLDLLIPGGIGSTTGLFRNNGNGTFTDVSVDSGINVSGHGSVVAGDIDNDGYPDVYLSREGTLMGSAMNPPRLFHNNGDGTFTDISETAGLFDSESTGMAIMGDINNDGFLDMFVTSPGHRDFIIPPSKQTAEHLFLNNGDLTFTDITESAGVDAALGSCVASFSHYDDDNRIDLFVGDCNSIEGLETPFHIYRNTGNNTFIDVGVEAGLTNGHWMSSTLGDYDNDGDLDLFATNFGPISPLGIVESHALFRNNGDGTYTDVAPHEMAINQFSFGATFADWDNDGWLDLFFTGAVPFAGLIGPEVGNPGHMFFNDGTGKFIENNEAHGLDLKNQFTTGVAQADYDQDGFIDFAIFTTEYEVTDPITGEVLLSDNGAPILMKNKGNKNHWVTIRPHGKESNSMAIGAKMQLYTRHTTQLREVYAGSGFASSESPWPTFGMGNNRKGMLKIKWPSGLEERFKIRSKRVIDIYEGHGISLKRIHEKHEKHEDHDYDD